MQAHDASFAAVLNHLCQYSCHTNCLNAPAYNRANPEHGQCAHAPAQLKQLGGCVCTLLMYTIFLLLSLIWELLSSGMAHCIFHL